MPAELFLNSMGREANVLGQSTSGKISSRCSDERDQLMPVTNILQRRTNSTQLQLPFVPID